VGPGQLRLGARLHRGDRVRTPTRCRAAGQPARDLAVVLNPLNERVLYGTLSGDGPAVAEDDVVDVLLDVWLRVSYHPPAG
jgi:hypothetical protein